MRKFTLKENVLGILSLLAVVFGGVIIVGCILGFLACLVIGGCMFVSNDPNFGKILLLAICCLVVFVLSLLLVSLGYDKLKKFDSEES